MVQNWANKTPENFKFTAKFPKAITRKKIRNVERELSQFYESMIPLKKKLLALLIQLPAYLKIAEGLEGLKQYDFYFDDVFKYAEVRHHSWFNKLAYNFFKNNNMCMVWSQQDKLATPPIVTTDFIYLRLIGERSIEEKTLERFKKTEQWRCRSWDTGDGRDRNSSSESADDTIQKSIS